MSQPNTNSTPQVMPKYAHHSTPGVYGRDQTTTPKLVVPPDIQISS